MQPAGTFNMHNQAQLLTFTTAQPEVKEILNPRDQEKRPSERCGHWRQRGKSPENSAHIHRFFKRQGRNVLASEKTAQIIPHTIISVLRSIPASSCVCVSRFSSAGVVSKENQWLRTDCIKPQREIYMRKMEKFRNDRTLCQTEPSENCETHLISGCAPSTI